MCVDDPSSAETGTKFGEHRAINDRRRSRKVGPDSSALEAASTFSFPFRPLRQALLHATVTLLVPPCRARHVSIVSHSVATDAHATHTNTPTIGGRTIAPAYPTRQCRVGGTCTGRELQLFFFVFSKCCARALALMPTNSQRCCAKFRPPMLQQSRRSRGAAFAPIPTQSRYVPEVESAAFLCAALSIQNWASPCD